MFRQPVAPIDHQIPFDDHMRSGQGHIGDYKEGQHADLHNEAAHGVLLQGIEQARAPLRKQHSHDHLPHGQDSQEENAAPNFQPLVRTPELLCQSKKFNKKMFRFRHLDSGLNE